MKEESLYIDTTVGGKSVHKYSIRNADGFIGSRDIDELINFVLDRGIDPNTELYVDGNRSGELLFDLIQE